MAARVGAAAAASIGAPTDPALHTRLKDPAEPFRFSFPDLQGRIVSNTDAQFRDKVVLLNISGSWCPNCHDEAPFLAPRYNRYRAKGLEIVISSAAASATTPCSMFTTSAIAPIHPIAI